MIAHRKFSITPTSSATELRLLIDGVPQPFSTWALTGQPGTDICERWVVEGTALEDETSILVDNTAICRLSTAEATKLGLPPLTRLRAVVEGSGIMVRPDFSISLH